MPTDQQPPGAASEIEAKLLAADEATLRELAGRRSIGRFQLRELASASLQSVYLDTGDRRLQANGIAMRLRRKPSGYEMTAKWHGTIQGDVHTRREINVALVDEPAPPYPLPAGPLRDALVEVVGQQPLEAIAVVDIERQTVDLLDEDGTRVAELALDVVRHCAPGTAPSDAAYFEVEVELVGGAADSIHEIAALLRDALPLQPTSETKFSRAMRAIHGSEVSPRGRDTP